MITITLSHDEKNTHELIAGLLRDKGYAISGSREDGVLQAHRNDTDDPGSSLEKIVIRIGQDLYNECKGEIYRLILEKVERPLIEYALERSEGNQVKAAAALGINRNTIRSKIRKLAIDTERWR